MEDMLLELRDFENKVVIVTGAARGIGRAVAVLFSERGAHVVVNDVLEEAANETVNAIGNLGGSAIAVGADVADALAVDKLLSTTLSTFSRIDILVNNAGVLCSTRLPEISEEEWNLVINSTLKGTFLCSQAVIPHFVREKRGQIINISSSAGKSVSTLGGAHYTAAKAGVLGLTRAFAKEMGEYNIRVNAVCPGLVNTDMVHRHVSPEMLQHFIETFPISRICEANEVAELVLFLASDKANYITGAAIDINGGDLMV
jgi:NAD(P)-dependent dehydrogenase (short-subunit alcohol dehydrogenase family)